MKTSDKGLIAIARHEGLVPAPYLDVANVWTFGIGHAETAGTPPKPSQMPRGMPADIDGAVRQSFVLFRAKIGAYENAVSRAVSAPLAQHEFDALVSLCFNIGAGAFQRSSVVRHLTHGDKARATDAILAWNKARVDGVLKVVGRLATRRQEEKRMFEAADYGRLSFPVWGLRGDRPDMSRSIRTITEAEALAYLAAPSMPIIATPPAPAPVVPEAPPRAQYRRMLPPEAPAPRGLWASILALLARIFGGRT